MAEVQRLREIVAKLREPGGCPWDREQTHASLGPALIEECYEVLEAIELADDENLQEELGDLLLHVVMHARMAQERGAFEFSQVAESICEKLVRRHPHVFGEESIEDSAAVLQRWEAIKRMEKSERTSVLDGVPKSLPAAMRAQKIQKKAARVGFDWEHAGEVLDKIDEESRELKEAMQEGQPDRIAEELGDLLFSVVNLSRKLGLEAETVLASATEKFARRFRMVETAVAEQGRSMDACSTEELNAIWDAGKHGVLENE